MWQQLITSHIDASQLVWALFPLQVFTSVCACASVCESACMRVYACVCAHVCLCIYHVLLKLCAFVCVRVPIRTVWLVLKF